MRLLLFLTLAACAGNPPRPTQGPLVHGQVSIAPSVDKSLPRAGTLVMYWMTKAELELAMSGSRDLTPLQKLFDHLAVIGPADLSAPVAYTLPVEQGDIVVSAVLDNRHDAMGALLGARRNPGDGVLMGDAPPVHVTGSAERDVVLDQVTQAPPFSEKCAGPRRELVELDAPEVAGAMGNETRRRVCVVLPRSYDSGRRYPVVYEFPGWGSDDNHMISSYHHDAIFEEAAPEAILAIVDTSTKSGSSYLVDSPRTGSWDRYVAARVIPAVDARFRTIASREGRATAGLSTGGFGALSFGLRHPELFGVVSASAPDAPDIARWLFDPAPAWSLAMLRVEAATGGAGFFASWGNDWSPDDSERGWSLPLDPATGQPVPAVIERWRAQAPAAWLDNPARAAAIAKAFGGKICLSVGKKDEFGLLQTTSAFSEKLKSRGVEHELSLAPGGHIDPEVMSLAYRCIAALTKSVP